MQLHHPTQEIINNLDNLHKIATQLNNTNQLDTNHLKQVKQHIIALDKLLLN